jgi:hypothetical protein
MIITQTSSAEEQKACRDRAEKMGIRIAWESPLEAGHYMQLHPADTGGCFFEIDWHETNEHQGDWPPAGGSGWVRHIRTEVISAIKAAELQSSDPEVLAKRWSAIANMPLRTDKTGQREMLLSNASIRFVEETDGRGEGLGGIDIEAADPEKLLQAAEERGMRISDTQVIICGVRFNLV